MFLGKIVHRLIVIKFIRTRLQYQTLYLCKLLSYSPENSQPLKQSIGLSESIPIFNYKYNS